MRNPRLFSDVHSGEIAMTSVLSRQQVVDAIPVEAVAKVLNKNGIRHILVGAHGLSGWRQEARATERVELIVSTRQARKATQALVSRFPKLQFKSQGTAIRLCIKKSDSVRISLQTTVQPLLRGAFKHVIATKVANETCLVPTLEMALAIKFAGFVSTTAELDAVYMDAADFIRMVKVNPAIDKAALAKLGSLVNPNGGAEIVSRVETILAGRKFNL